MMALGGAALLLGLLTGLFRLGWNLHVINATLPPFHGPLMVSGFLGTLIGLERTVALKHRWSYIVPLLSGIGALALILGPLISFGIILMTLSSAGLVFLLLLIFYHHLALYAIVMILGASCWFVGNGLWLLGLPFYKVILWWIGFLILTIAGERLELSRIFRLSRGGNLVFILAVSVFIIGALLGIRVFSVGVRVASIGIITLALWLLINDIVRHTVHKSGLSRFMAVSLLTGYIWLGVSGILGLLFGSETAGFYYDAFLHSVFVGFVFSMIFAHAPIIFPTLLDLPAFLSFRSSFYAHLTLLHLSLILRIMGDIARWLPGRQWGGLFNVFAILLFFGNVAYLSRQFIQERFPRPPS
jgi:hypothetical protein